MTIANHDRLRIAAATVGCVLVGIAALVAWNSPAAAYEVSIYSATPPFVWLGIGLALAIFVGLVVSGAYSDNKCRKTWVLGLAGILLCNSLVLVLHVIRGYAFWYAIGDPGSHVGRIEQVLIDGHLQSGNMYPILHLFVAEASSATGLAVRYLGLVMPLVFTLVGFVFAYLWARSVFRSKALILLTTLAGTMLVGGWYLNLTPNHMGNMLFFMFLYLATHRLNNLGSERLTPVLLLALFLLPLVHVVVAFAVLFVIGGLSLGHLLLTRHGFSGAHGLPILRRGVGCLLAVWTVVWIRGFGVWAAVWRALLQAAGGAVDAALEQARYAAALGYDVAAFFFKSYFDILFFGAMALVAFPILIRSWKSRAESGRLISLYGPLLVVGTLYLATAFVNMYGMQRTTVYFVKLATPFVGFVLAWLGTTRVSKRALVSGVTLVLLLLSGLGIMRVYPSPYINSFNPQTTHAEIEGWSWFFPHDVGLGILGLYAAPGRMADMLGYSVGAGEGDVSYPSYIGQAALDTLYSAYEEYPEMGRDSDSDAYLLLSELDWRLYVDIYPKLAGTRFEPWKLAMLDHDPTLGRLYANRGFETWLVTAMN